jgi:hypothetical protein
VLVMRLDRERDMFLLIGSLDCLHVITYELLRRTSGSGLSPGGR